MVLNGFLNLISAGMVLDLIQEVLEAVVGVDPQLLEDLLVLCEHRRVELLDTVTEDDGVTDFHHGGLKVQRKKCLGLVALLNLSSEKLSELLRSHNAGVNEFLFLQSHFLQKPFFSLFRLEKYLY